MRELFGSIPDHDAFGVEVPAPWRIRRIQGALLAGLFLAAGFLGSIENTSPVGRAAFWSAIIVGGSTFVPGTLRGLLRGQLGVGTLMTAAAVGAILLGEVAEAATLTFLLSISEALEDYAISRMRTRLRTLVGLSPASVRVRRDGSEVTIAATELRAPDIMLVGPGDRFATDGIVRDGTSNVDFSVITGESVAVQVSPGRQVLAAAVNGGSMLEVEVTAPPAESSLARVIRIVESAQDRKGERERVAERLARPLVPAVLAGALLLAVVGSILGDPQVWIARALVVLVAAAPCALAIAVPVTVVAAVGASARFGAIIKGGAALEALADVRILAVGKTGTLTRNQPRITEVIVADGSSQQEVLGIAAALEARSDHSFAATVIAAGPRETYRATALRAVPGSGVLGIVEGEMARLGKPSFVEIGDLGPTVRDLEAVGRTVVAVERSDYILGAIAICDEVRPEAADAIRALPALGIDRVVMLSGDNERASLAVGRTVGIGEVYGDLEPGDKARLVKALQLYGPTGMVGDGVSDGFALAGADVGIAFGARGNAVAIDTADVALMGEDIGILPAVIDHAQRASAIMRQSLALSSATLLALVPLAAFGVMGLAAVVVAHELAELLVIANGLRAGRRSRWAKFRTPDPDNVRHLFPTTAS